MESNTCNNNTIKFLAKDGLKIVSSYNFVNFIEKISILQVIMISQDGYFGQLLSLYGLNIIIYHMLEFLIIRMC